VEEEDIQLLRRRPQRFYERWGRQHTGTMIPYCAVRATTGDVRRRRWAWQTRPGTAASPPQQSHARSLAHQPIAGRR